MWNTILAIRLVINRKFLVRVKKRDVTEVVGGGMGTFWRSFDVLDFGGVQEILEPYLSRCVIGWIGWIGAHAHKPETFKWLPKYIRIKLVFLFSSGLL